MRILLVEDDRNLGPSLKELLQNEGFEVDFATDLKTATQLFHNSPKLLILDWVLPDGQGIDFLKNMRKKGHLIPVIMLTARSELIDKVVGLESGANDYLTKPFEPRELLARVRVQLRDKAQSRQPEQKLISVGDLQIDLLQRKVSFEGKDVELTKMEYEFLKLLAKAPGRVFSREEILNKVWGFDNFPSTRTVDTHVLQLRQKLRDDLIETIRGIGYRYKE